MASYNLNEMLKRSDKGSNKPGNKDEMHLDDAERVKVLSPMQQVFKRFFRNRLAVFGLVLLGIMFVFSFLGPLFYPYGQTEIFRKYDTQKTDYALAKERAEFTSYVIDNELEIDSTVANKANSNILTMVSKNVDLMRTNGKDGFFYDLVSLEDNIYVLTKLETQKVASFGSTQTHVGLCSVTQQSVTFDGEDLGEEFTATALKSMKGTSGSFEFGGLTYDYQKASAPKTYDIYLTQDNGFLYEGSNLGAEFESAAQSATESSDQFRFQIGGKEYFVVEVSEGSYEAYAYLNESPAMAFTRYAFDAYETGASFSDEFKVQALLASCTTGAFEYDGASYTIAPEEDVLVVRGSDGAEVAELSTFVIRRYNGADTMELGLKDAIREKVEYMAESGEKTATLTYRIPQQKEDGTYDYDEEGNLLYNDSELTITRKDTGEYLVNCDQIILLIDIYAPPSGTHLLGTDGDGFDVLARMMYGGRISLMVGFVVVFLETLLGVIMGGLAGYFGGWVDNIIMRLVDIFYCLPMMPIMIIIGAMMDAIRMDYYVRLMVMMGALGVMGWAGIARLVRGQILSLREQEFMVATEATGIRVKRRIFRHLVPNVMPQLIVSATMGLGGTILTESTLSFLGLGVKHPLATWGTMINSVSTASAMTHYTYIWIPVGMLICLTVIAFNFVGDGLRDAFDPKGKR